MIKAVLFDFDGVLTTDKTGSVSTMRSLSAQTGLAEDTLWEAFAPFNSELLVGRTSHAAVWSSICTRLGRELDPSLLVHAFDSTPMSDEMLRYAASLRPKYATAIITDNKADRMGHLSEQHALGSLFDTILVSAEHGSGKDQPGIFRRALALLGVAAEQCIFIDNSPRNLEAPAALGINVVYFNELTDTAASLAGLLKSRYGVAASRVTPQTSFKQKPLFGSA